MIFLGLGLGFGVIYDKGYKFVRENYNKGVSWSMKFGLVNLYRKILGSYFFKDLNL